MDLSGYLLETLREDPTFVLYRGQKPDKTAPILVLAPASPELRMASLRRLEHEHALSEDLDPAWAAKPLALARHEGHTVLVLSDAGGRPLDGLLGKPLELVQFLNVAIGLVAALRQVHGRGLIHKDIKPANVLVDASGHVWLTGFGLASRLLRERQAPAPPQVVAGTLAYMAPEQTGRMNRSIDARSDLYSLGVTLYEMLTGVLPFVAADAMEWIHCHIARQPIPPRERVTSVPQPLEAILLKLLAKTGEDRYQTAAGVAADLQRCLAEWESYGRIDPFPLSARDVSDRILIPEKLYGREREIDTLLAAFDRVVAHGTTEFVLVSGYSGIGKSSVVNELHKVLVPPRGLFASGKFDQYKRDIPYATLAQAFQSLVRPLLGQSEAELGRWSDALREALGQNVQLMVNLVPELELVIGTQPPVPDLPPQDAKNLFQMVFRRFLGVFARKEHPLALFLDDLQWLDTATLDLLEHLVTHSEVRHLMLVGAYRDNEVGRAHPLLRTLEAIRKAGARVHEIVLAPLGLDDVGRLVADALHCAPERARPLAQLVHEKTGGNPFFAIQFFTALAEEGLLAFDRVASAWQWDIDRICARSYTDNVVDLMAGKLIRFSATTQEALKQLACLGSVAEIATLTLVHGETEEASHAALWEAVRAGLVLYQDGAYEFLHDRIQQTAYSLIPEEHRAEVHLRLGRALLASMTAEGLAEHLFDVASQFNRGALLLVERDEKAQVATINLRAGRKAKASAAYASACMYLAAGMALLGESDWGGQYELMFGLWLERAECEFLSSNFDTAGQLIGELLQRGASKVDQADAYRLKIQLHEVKAEYPQAVASALTCLRLFGIDIPAHPTWEQVQAEYETVWRNLNGRPIENLIDLPLMTDPELQAATRLLSILLNAAYYSDFHLFCLYLCRLVNISIQHGTSGASAHAFGWFGNILGAVFHRYREGYSLGRLACDLVEKHGFIAYQARLHLTMNTVAIWTQPIASALDSNRAAFRTATETGDLTYACYSVMHTIADLLVRNDPLDAVWRESERGLDFVRKARYHDIADTIVSQQRFIAAMQGRTATFSTFSDAQFDEAAFEAQLTGDRMTTMVCYYWILKLKARFLSGDYTEALAAADKAKALLWAATGQIYLLDYFYYTALTAAALYEDASTDEQIGWRALLTAHRGQLREWADNYPPTFADKHALVSAEITRLEGREADAMRLYEQAIQSAREHGFVQSEGTAHEVAARFYASRGFETISHAYLRNARSCYLRWGADGKVRQLEQAHLHLRQGPVSPGYDSAIGLPVDDLELATVVKVSQAISSEIDLKKLIDTLMVIAVQHAGAVRGLLILPRGDELWIAAEAITVRDTVDVRLQQAPVAPADLPETVFHYVVRSRDSLLVDDAANQNPFPEDEYILRNHCRSILCLPLVKQAKLIGVLYLENNQTPHVFTKARIAVLRLLASQAAISLENARLYSDLRHTEASLAAAQRLTRTGSFVIKVSSEKLFWSEGMYRIYEIDPANKLTIETFLQHTHPAEVSLLRKFIDRVPRDGSDFDLEHRLLMSDGSVKNLHVVVHAEGDESAEVAFVGTVMDVTASKQSQERLQASLQEKESQAAYLAEAQKLSHTGSFGWNVSSGAIFLSEESFRIFEYEPATKPTVEMVLNRVHPDDVARVRQVIDRAASDKQDFDFEHRLLMPNGSVKHVHIVAYALTDEAGRTEFVGAVMDVTAAKEASNKIQLIIDTVPALIWTAKPEGSLDFISQRLLDYQGLTLEQKREQGWGAQLHPDDIDHVRSKWRAAVAEGKPFEAETRLRRFDGEYRWFLYRAFPLFDRSGHNLGWYGNDIDIHDGKQVEEALRQARADLARVNRVTTMGELAASLAHEVNQPIGAAVANAESCLSWLAGEVPNLEEARAAASNIVKNGMRAAEIITRTRQLFKKDTWQRESVDVNEVIREMIVLLRNEATRYSISVRTELAADLPQVMGDRVQLQQVAMNLIMNSIEATKDVDATRELVIKSQRAENGQVMVSVSDTGVGLPPRQADQIFNAFFTTKPHGTGMGLSISRSIVEAHGGCLRAADNSPRGASFHLTLPAKIEAHG